MTNPTVGVEEEFHLVDASTRQLRPQAPLVVDEARRRVGDEVDPELLQTQVEIGTPVAKGLGEVRAELTRLRKQVGAAALEADCRIVASGTYPGVVTTPPVTDSDRYVAMSQLFGMLAREQVVCGSHVHVATADRDQAVAVLRRARPWLPVLLAMSANSPYWQGEDSGYASYRMQVWSRWPTAGPPAPFRSAQEYDDVVEQLLATGALRDQGMLYWLVRLSARYDTVEFRVADVPLGVDDSVLMAGISRGLALRSLQAEAGGEPIEDVRDEVLRAAVWRGARFGLDGELLHPATSRPAPAVEVVRQLLDHVRPALEELGEADEVQALTDDVLGRGNGAARQRAAYQRGGMPAVLDLLVRETAPA